MTDMAEKQGVFGAYSHYYDLLYSEKDYSGEAAYVLAELGKYKAPLSSILDLGCGSAKHALEFAARGINVTGVELSKTMLLLAKRNLDRAGNEGGRVRLMEGDLTKIDAGQVFDAAVALFHVMSYQTSNESLLSSLNNAGKHLAPGGLFMFDYWYGPGVLSDRPTERLKELQNAEVMVRRRAVPVMKINENAVEVNYDIMITSSKNGSTEEFREVHVMRYFFLPEIELALRLTGFEPLMHAEWMTGRQLSDKSWYAVTVCRKR